MPAPFFPAPQGLPAMFLVIPPVILAVTLVQLVVAMSDLILGRLSASWPSVAGTIEESGVVHRGGTRNPYRPAITYTYTVEGRTYRRGRRIFGAEGAHLSGGAEGIAARYRVGEKVRVAHHPTRHGLAVLEPGVRPNALARLGQAGLGLVVIVPIMRFILPSLLSTLGIGG